MKYKITNQPDQEILDSFLGANCSNVGNNIGQQVVRFIKSIVKQAMEEIIEEKKCENVLFDQKLTTKQLCGRWNISDTTLLTWEKRGVITPIQTGGRKKLYSLKDVREAEVNGFIKNVA